LLLEALPEDFGVDCSLVVPFWLVMRQPLTASAFIESSFKRAN